MDLLEKCFYNNFALLENHARNLGISYETFKSQMEAVAKNEKVYDMTMKVRDVYKSNPKAAINFGEYGANVAKEVNLEPDFMFRAIAGCASNDLVLNVVSQIRVAFKLPPTEEKKDV
ncbi:MAG: hypothetical protein U0457_10535 [Candidatus Sericytochromatia bacterium]